MSVEVNWNDINRMNKEVPPQERKAASSRRDSQTAKDPRVEMDGLRAKHGDEWVGPENDLSDELARAGRQLEELTEQWDAALENEKDRIEQGKEFLAETDRKKFEKESLAEFNDKMQSEIGVDLAIAKDLVEGIPTIMEDLANGETSGAENHFEG